MAAPLRSFSFAFVATAALLFAACGSDTTSITGGTEETGATATANTATIGSDALPDTEPLTADTVDTPATTEPSTTQPTSGTGFGASGDAGSADGLRDRRAPVADQICPPLTSRAAHKIMITDEY